MKKILTALLFLLAMNMQFANAATGIVPQPREMHIREGEFTISNETSVFIAYTPLKEYVEDLFKKAGLYPTFYKNQKIKCDSNYIAVIADKGCGMGEEEYSLECDSRSITIRCSGYRGAFYGIQTLLQLMPAEIYSGAGYAVKQWTVPAVEIRDCPEYGYRGVMLDVSRTFFSTDDIKTLLDRMAYLKLNKFHWHLADDNGWRIEIDGYSDLTEKGAWRGDNEVLPPTFGSGHGRYGGYYTKEEAKEIVRYAAIRGIEIIPEIDLPGHSRALIACYPELGCHVKTGKSVQGEENNVICVGNEKVYKTLGNIISELSDIFPGEYIHIGGDEVNTEGWEKCPECRKLMKRENMKSAAELQAYFTERMYRIVTDNGKKMAAWDEVIESEKKYDDAMIYGWRSTASATDALEKGYRTVLQIGEYCYYDMKQSEIERGHNWAAIVTLEKAYSLAPEKFTGNVAGVQAGLWTELLNKPFRFLDYQLFPRLAALSEIGWCKPENRDFESFRTKLERDFYLKMYHMGIRFRLPYPKAEYSYQDSCITVTPAYESAVVRYTDDNTAPDMDSKVYTGKIKTDKPQDYRFATFYGTDLSSIPVIADGIENLFIQPEMKVTSTLGEDRRFPLSNLELHKKGKYFRSDRRAAEGDNVTFTFAAPVKCSKIMVRSGIPDITLYGVTDGYVEYSYDGKNFIKGDDIMDNNATIVPEKPVAAIRIVITASNDAHTLAIQAPLFFK